MSLAIEVSLLYDIDDLLLKIKLLRARLKSFTTLCRFLPLHDGLKMISKKPQQDVYDVSCKHEMISLQNKAK